MLKTKVIIIGAGGFGREVLWSIIDINKLLEKYDFLGFIDDDKKLWNTKIHGHNVLGGLNWFSKHKDEDFSCVIAIGDPKIRKKIVDTLSSYDLSYETIIHPSVIFSDSIQIGIGTIIQAGVILTVDTKIGNHVHINIHSTIGHDCNVSDFVTINPGVHVNGDTKIGEGSFLGSGATLKHNIILERWSVIGAGSVLLSNTKEFSIYVGVPAKFKKTLI
jgi:sugar O-acyltransferase (sialic acid O-acetyltransferase NeuD family)